MAQTRRNPKEEVIAPLLPALHRAQAADGCVTKETLEKLAASLGMLMAELYSTATFYHYFSVGDQKIITRGRCRGPVCSLPGIAIRDEKEIPSIACPGLCDQPVAEYEAARFFTAGSLDGGFRLPRSVDREQAIFRQIVSPEQEDVEAYKKTGGYEQWLRLLKNNGAAKSLNELRASGLSGRGGAGFPLAEKWRSVRDARVTPKYVVCNADEGEPGTFKDRPILHLQPHLLLESMAICGYIVGADTGVIYLRYEYPRAFKVLSRAIEEAEKAGLLGNNIAGSGYNFDIVIRRGAGSYVCGEESALLNSLEGRRPWPRERPPFPTSEGLWGKPTVVNNVETLCCGPAILEKGADWFRSLGEGENAGTKIYSVSGKVKRPGNYELPLGIRARELIMNYAGGPASGRSVKAFTLGGISGGLLRGDLLDLSLDYHSPRQHGASLGSGGVIVLDNSCCVVNFARTCMLFYESESCGKCYPCRIGTVRLRELLDGLTGRRSLPHDSEKQIEEIGAAMAATSACGLGQSAPVVVRGMFKFFADEVNEHSQGKKCSASVCAL